MLLHAVPEPVTESAGALSKNGKAMINQRKVAQLRQTNARIGFR